MPVVLIHGPRQCGKTTLAKQVGIPLGYEYLTFDDALVRAAALADPTGFVDGLSERMILDEVQRVPELFLAIKVAVDRRRVPSRFLLTGSANVLLVPTLADSLAGRMQMLRLHPLAQCELESHVRTSSMRCSPTDFISNARIAWATNLLGELPTVVFPPRLRDPTDGVAPRGTATISTRW